MLRSNVLVIVVDGLRASALGAYGNTTYLTPALDSFAADSLLLDACFAPAADLLGVYRAMWQSRHPARGEASQDAAAYAAAHQSLPGLLGELGYHTALITDESKLNSFPLAVDFHENIRLHDPSESPPVGGRADNIAETTLANLFATVCETVGHESSMAIGAAAKVSQPKFVWVHAQGMYGAWDAPVELQKTLLDENDPSPIEQVAPPNFVLQATDDPDVAFQYSSAYAAQVMVLDACWQGLLDAIDANGCSTPWLVMLVGSRGFPLGEHRQIGGVDLRLYAEQLHVPFMVRCADGRGRLARNTALTTHMDIMPTLLEAIDANCRSADQVVEGISALPLASGLRNGYRDTLVSVAMNETLSIRNSAWSLRVPTFASPERQSNELSSAPELFVRPDDRWEANDVSKLCPDVVVELVEVATRTLTSLRDGEPMPHNVVTESVEPVAP